MTVEVGDGAALVDRLFGQYLRLPPLLSVADWADQNRVLPRETSSEPGRWRTSRTPYVRQILEDLSDDSDTEVVVLQFGTQLSKALALDTPIPTPSGWTTMGDLAVGDVVFDERGLQCRVISKSPVFVGHKCFAVAFDDGEVIIADAGHRWAIYDRKGKPRIRTTVEIADTIPGRQGSQARIDVAGPLDTGPDGELPVDPYVLGAWLGDGNSGCAIVTVDQRDSLLTDLERILGPLEVVARNSEHVCAVHLGRRTDAYRLRCGRGHDKKLYKQKWQCLTCANLHAQARRAGKQLPKVVPPLDGATAELRRLGVLNNKHIPGRYLRASTRQRWALLQGLMDSDGAAQKCGNVCFSVTNERLAVDVLELMRSLGLKPKLARGHAKLNGVVVSPEFRVTATAYSDQQVFRMRRKQERLKDRHDPRAKPTETGRRSIVAVTEVESVPVQCISVDSQSHLFLAGRSMIPTHNSETGLNWTGYVIDHSPGPMLLIQPTVDLGKRYSKQRIATMLRACECLAGKVRDSRSRDSGNTTMVKEFPGGILVITGANSAAGLASMPARYIHADEVDDYPLDVDGQGEPLQLAVARQDTFARRKRLVTSSPKRPPKLSLIESLRESGTDSEYRVPCPHCGHYQALVWAEDEDSPGLRYFDDDPQTAVYVCAGCAAHIEESAKPGMLAAGVWVARNESPQPKVRSYHLSSLYSPLGWASWAKICAEHKSAVAAKKRGDAAPYKTWVNTRLALTWKDEGAKLSADKLRERAVERAPRLVPACCLVLTAGVDVQDNRLEVVVWGWGDGEECAPIEYLQIWGDPLRLERTPDGQPTVWERLDDALAQRYPHEGGQSLAVEAVAIDTGGHCTHAVYAYCRTRKAHPVHVNGVSWIRRTFAIKGADRPGMPVKGKATNVDVNIAGKVLPGGVMLWHVGTGTAKDWLHGHLQVRDPGPGFVHLSKALPSEWFDQMTSEQRVMARTSRGYRYVWVVEPGKRNEAWDCSVYALFAAHALDLFRFTSGMWQRVRERVAPVQAGLFEQSRRSADQKPEQDDRPVAAESTDSKPQTRTRAEGWLPQRGKPWLSRNPR